MMRYDTTLATVDTVLGIYRWIELSAAGMQEDTADVAEHCYYENAMQGGMDSYYNVDDTVRYCNLSYQRRNISDGNGVGIHDNVVVADGRYTAAISVDNTGAERCVFTQCHYMSWTRIKGCGPNAPAVQLNFIITKSIALW